MAEIISAREASGENRASTVTNVVIMGAAGRDFHNFNAFFRMNPKYKVVAFTAAQIPNIAGRVYPHELAGALYPSGIPILPDVRYEFRLRAFLTNLLAKERCEGTNS